MFFTIKKNNGTNNVMHFQSLVALEKEVHNEKLSINFLKKTQVGGVLAH